MAEPVNIQQEAWYDGEPAHGPVVAHDDSAELPAEMASMFMPGAGTAPPVTNSEPDQWAKMTDSEKLDALHSEFQVCAAQVEWLCAQLHGLLTAASNMGGIGGMMMRKGMGL